MEFYCYTGDIKKLKPNGWTFQKLYARNYKTYRKNGIIMYVVSKMMVEMDNIRTKYQPRVIGFILENIDKPDDFWQEPSPFFTNTLFPVWAIQDGQIMTSKQANKNKSAWYQAWEKDNGIEYLEDGEKIRFKWIQTVKELVELGGIELREIK